MAGCATGGDDADTGGSGDSSLAACVSERLKVASAPLSGLFAGLSRGPVLAQAKKTLTIGTFGDRTGANAQLIVPSHNAMQLAIDDANAKGDLPVTLAFKPIDNKDAKPDTAPAIAQQFIGDPSVIAVLGGGFSGESAATGQLFGEAGLLFFTASATRTDLTAQGFKTFFRGLGNDDSQGAAAVETFEKIGCKKTAVVNDKSPYGAGLGASFTKSAKEEDLEVVLDEGIEPTQDYTTLIDSVLAKDPDSLFYAGYGSEFQFLVKQLREKGFEGIIASGDGSKSDDIGTKIGAEAAEGVVLLCPCPDVNLLKSDEAETLVKAYKAKFNENPGVYAAEGYDVANATIDAIRECGKGGADGITRECVVEKVKTRKYKGITKTMDFEPTGQVKTQQVSVFVIRKEKVTEVGLTSLLK